jgi:hypothetical protein
MRNYRVNAASEARVDYGVALVRGLSNFEKTRAHATAFKALNDELHAQLERRRALRKPWLEARQDVRFADWNGDQVIRAYQRAAEIADGGRRGPISQATLPDGISPVVAPSGSRQLPALVALIKRLKNARVEGIDAFRDAELPKLEAARTQLETAIAAYQAARTAYNEAFAVEKAMRDEHRLAVDALMGAVRAAFPGDKALQNVIFPDATVSRGVGDDADDDDDDVDAVDTDVTNG